jgi:MFS family permease
MDRVRAGKVLLVLSILGCLLVVLAVVVSRSLDRIHQSFWYWRIVRITIGLGVFIVLVSASALGLLWRDPRRAVAIGCVVIGLFAALSFTPTIRLLFFGYPRDSNIRGWVSGAQAAMRDVAVAIEAYMVETNQYAPWTLDPKRQAAFPHEVPPIPTFLTEEPGTLTPFSALQKHLSILPPAPFGRAKTPNGQWTHSTFAYWAPEDFGWILWSPGPDMVFDMDFEAVQKVYDVRRSNPTPELIAGYTYDPTNGMISAGDIWRVKQ